jgi:hypothetical protein
VSKNARKEEKSSRNKWLRTAWIGSRFEDTFYARREANMATEEQLENFRKAVKANPRLSQADKRQRIETLDRMYGGHIARAERTD